MLFTLRGHWPGAYFSWIFLLFSTSIEFYAGFAETTAEDIEHFFELIVQEDLVELVEVHIFTPLRHKLLLLSLTHVLIIFIWRPLLLEQVVRLIVLHLEW